MMGRRDESNPNLVPLARPVPEAATKRWALIVGLIVATGTAGTTVLSWVNWPWVLKQDAKVIDENHEARITELEVALIKMQSKFEAMPSAVADELDKRHYRRR